MADDTGTVMRIADLANRKPTPFDVSPDAAGRAAIAAALDVVSFKKLRFTGTLAPSGGKDWVLQAQLGATVVQECVVTLAPVTTRIDEAVQRTYLAQFTNVTGEEVEMPDDDTIEPLPETVDLIAVLTEALALALPAFPRAEGVSLGDAVYTAPGANAMTDADARPFAGLGALRAALRKDDDDA